MWLAHNEASGPSGRLPESWGGCVGARVADESSPDATWARRPSSASMSSPSDDSLTPLVDALLRSPDPAQRREES